MVIINNPGPITTCLRKDQPENTTNRIGLQVEGHGEGVVGWITRLPWWSEDTWHVSACYEGRVYLVGYVSNAAHIWPTLKQWFADFKEREERRAIDE